MEEQGRGEKRPNGAGVTSGRASHLDRGYAWVVLAVTFVAAVICNGYMFNVGIYYVVFLQHFGQSRAVTSWIAASQGICLCVSGPVSSLLLPRLGARKTLLLGAAINSAAIASNFLADSVFYVITTFGLAGFGGGLVITSTLAGVALYFDRYLYMATGLVNSGVGVGIMLLGVQIEQTMVSFGWRGAMLIQAGLALQMLVCGALIFDLPKEDAVVLPEGQGRVTADGGQSLTSIFRDARFWLLVACFLLYFALLTILMGLIKDLAISKGLEDSYGLIITCFGVTNTLGRALSGFFAAYVHPPLLFFAASALCALAVAGLALTSVRWVFVACVGLFAFNTGQQAVQLSLTLSFIFSRQMMAILYGYGMFMGAVSIVGMSPLVGYMIDSSGGFDSALWLTSGGLLLCGFLVLLSYLLHQKNLGQATKYESEKPGEMDGLKPFIDHQSG